MTHILLVDDDPLVLAAIKRQLLAGGHQVSACNEVSRGLIELAAGGIDVLIADNSIGPDSGLDLLRGAADFSPSTRCVLISGNITSNERRIAYELGAIQVLEKPFSAGELADIVKTCLPEPRHAPATSEPLTPTP
jgi:DNA-binding NtrC family response regulator